MKIKPEHYARMKYEIAKIAGHLPEHRENLKSDPRVKDLEMRLRWDASRAAGLTRFICDEVYLYANDTHVDTALRKIMVELGI